MPLKNYQYKKDYQILILQALEKDFSNSQDFLNFKKLFCNQRHIPQPTNADLRELYEKMIQQRKIKRKKELEKFMQTRAIRTQSGVAIVAVLTKPYPCPGKCIFCPSANNMPKSYLPNEPAVMRAVMNKFHPYLQVQSRLQALNLNGHPLDKIELIVMGGTFSYFPQRYQRWFIKECFRAANDFPQKIPFRKSFSYLFTRSNKIKHVSLKQLLLEQQRNEKAKTRIVGLTLETRPDYINSSEIENFRQLGCTRVEIGVQSVFNKVLELNQRGHNVETTIQATRLLKNSGFKINYHIMPGLYGSDQTIKNKKGGPSDLEMFRQLFSSAKFQPDMLKIYPTVVIKNSYLYQLWKQGKYIPLTDKEFEKLMIKVKNEIIPPYVRIQRLVRDVPLTSIEAGPKISNLRQILATKTHCQCIRCREIKGEKYNQNEIILNRIDYKASGGKEIFLQFIGNSSQNKNKLYALLRLRIPYLKYSQNNFSEKIYQKFPILKKAAIVREVHTYGKLVSLGKTEQKSPQHTGFGKKLIQEAEKIARQELTQLKIPPAQQKIVIISGVGVRDYYRHLGYRLQNSYMVKKLA